MTEAPIRDSTHAIIVAIGEDGPFEGGMRPRQNVIHELGFAQGALGQNNVILILGTLGNESGQFEPPSNISGMVYIPFDGKDIESVKTKLQRALVKIGVVSPPTPKQIRPE